MTQKDLEVYEIGLTAVVADGLGLPPLGPVGDISAAIGERDTTALRLMRNDVAAYKDVVRAVEQNKLDALKQQLVHSAGQEAAKLARHLSPPR
jgi:hypothetical protein